MKKKKSNYGHAPIFGSTLREQRPNHGKYQKSAVHKKHIDDIDYDSCYFSFSLMGENNCLPYAVLMHIDSLPDINWSL
jgi:D-hexose-6-phosphate mutarotase